MLLSKEDISAPSTTFPRRGVHRARAVSLQKVPSHRESCRTISLHVRLVTAFPFAAAPCGTSPTSAPVPEVGREQSCSREQREGEMSRTPGYRSAPETNTGMAAPTSLHHANSESASFPTRAVVILSLVMTINSATLVSLFPYVGMMVKELLSLESTNEVGEQRQGTSGWYSARPHSRTSYLA